MADAASTRDAPLPFSNLDDLLLPLLLGTGSRGAVAIQMLMARRIGTAHFVGRQALDTPAGLLTVKLFNVNSARQLSIDLLMREGLGCIHGEVYAHECVVPDTLCAAAPGRPLSELCETAAAFPGRDRTMRRVRTLTSSTRILLEHEKVTCSLNDLSPTATWSVEDPSRPRAPRKKECA